MEFDLIQRHFVVPETPGADVILGVGDDCALLQARADHELCISCDSLVCGVHFLPDDDAADIGRKALAVNLSDLAACGADARWCTLALTLPQADESWLSAFSRGFLSTAQQHGMTLVGGDTTRGKTLSITVTVLGEVPVGQALRRSGGQVDDDVWISGRPGLAALGLALRQNPEGPVRHLSALWQRLCLTALKRPQPRLILGQKLRGLAHAAIDVSDGLLADLGHIARQSACGAQIFLNQLPHLPPDCAKDIELRRLALHCLLAGGDDYELCFTAPVAAQLTLAQLAAELDLPLWRIGRLCAAQELTHTADNPLAPAHVQLLDENFNAVEFSASGFNHF